jgi:phytoene dehydrogenase-like protein
MAGEGVICSMTPGQLYGRLLKSFPGVEAQRAETRGFVHGKGNMQIHYALKSAPQWHDPELGKVALLHLTPGLDGVSKAVNEAERGMLPAEPTICLGQPTAFDPSRAPDGKAILWLQLPEAPRHIKGDAAGEIASRRRALDGGRARGLCRPRREGSSAVIFRTLHLLSSAGAVTPPPISRR